ncbi:Zn(II)2Cys6 transcription factor [Aspergillus mulundensis]|uniref:Putative Zn(II)2Cys6 transcription factor n=1 Tax=Aspergillus mulundensis TaxID=1810919 RepID=A0A3D8QRF6_9EURO|nr:putative Zn(II)2Cys6 transcription factor [Aspergillus mulundensis]RDW64385.1 putative Zn(II)2Cys6 transcription factor [Aspergillus mulundensis]
MTDTRRKSANGGTPRPRIRPSRGRGLRTSTGCLTCRERRVKCDDGKPTCMRCTKAGRVCRYRQPQGSEHPGATGTGENRAAQPSITVETAPTPAPAPAPTPYFPVQLNGQDDLPDRGNISDHGLSVSSLEAQTLPFTLGEISTPFEWYDLLARDAISNIQRSGEPRNFPEITLSRRQSPAPECIEPPLGVLEYQSEPWNSDHRIELSAYDLIFFRYYIEVVGPILDLFDPARHFTNVVPHLGLRNTGLMKSILAVGAKHMSLGYTNAPGEVTSPGANASSPASLAGAANAAPGPSPAHMATHYYYETLQYLSQTLLYPSYADSRELLATSTMISTYEMFDADADRDDTSSGDWERHLRGSFWIQRSQDNDGEAADGLRRAVWWAWLRQDLWAAFRAGRPTLTIWRARRPLEELNSDELATRIVYICAKCVEYAASGKMPNQDQDPRARIEQGDQLLRALDDWYRALPPSYQPVAAAALDPQIGTVRRASSIMPSTSPADSTSWAADGTGAQEPSTVYIPPVWIHPANHAGAMQMYHFAKAVVLLNQPTMGGLNAYVARQKQLGESVQMVCGIANACQEHESAIAFVNVQALFAVGQFVQSPAMRVELIRTLENMLRISKIPANGLVAELKRVWQEASG